MNGVSEFNTFLATHKVQLESSAVPELYWFSLYAKLSKQVFDAGEQFSLLQVENDEEEAEWRVETTADVTENDPNQIFLIDHAWTFKTDQARQMLLHVPGLATRMARLMDIKVEEANDVPNDSLVELLMSAKWSYSQTYSVGNASSVEERQPVWLVSISVSLMYFSLATMFLGMSWTSLVAVSSTVILLHIGLCLYSGLATAWATPLCSPSTPTPFRQIHP